MHFLLSLLLVMLAAVAQADSVVDGIFRHQAARDTEIACLSYRARLRYIETDLRSHCVRQMECERLTTMPRFGRQHHEFGDANVNGQRLEGSARERELRRLRSRVLAAGDTRMPFFPETRSEYNYGVSGPDTWRGMPVWRVEFEPIEPTGKHIRGYALVLVDSFDVVSLEFVPCRLPFVVTAASMTLDYAFVQGYWLPVGFHMDMDLRLAVVIELMRKHIRIEDVYWDHRLNGDMQATADGE